MARKAFLLGLEIAPADGAPGTPLLEPRQPVDRRMCPIANRALLIYGGLLGGLILAPDARATAERSYVQGGAMPFRQVGLEIETRT